jgi:phenylalanyl-tRNA synthetase beta chain
VEIELSKLSLKPEPLQVESFARFPAAKRDLSLLVPETVSYGTIKDKVVASGGALLSTVDLFDIYRGKGVPAGHGAYGIRLKFRSAKGNLKGKAVDKAIAAILGELKNSLGIEPRV